MEKRMLLAFVLCALVLYLFMPPQPPRKPKPNQKPADPVEQKVEPKPEEPVKPESEPEPAEEATIPPPADWQEQEATIDTDLWHAVFTNHGARLKRFEFKKFFNQPTNQITNPDFNGRDESDPASRLKFLRADPSKPAEGQKLALTTRHRADSDLLETAPFTLAEDSSTDDKKVFVFVTPDNLRVTKTYAVVPDKAEPYTLRLTVTIENLAGSKRTIQLRQSGAAWYRQESQVNSNFEVIVAHGRPDNPQTTEVNAAELVKSDDRDKKTFRRTTDAERDGSLSNRTDMLWVATTNSFFGAALIPKLDKEQAVTAVIEPLTVNIKKLQEARPTASLLFEEVALGKDEQRTYNFDFYAGPRDYEFISKPLQERGLNAMIGYDTGSFLGVPTNFIRKPIAGVLKLFHGLFGNFGLAIIALTVVVRLLLHPLTKKQQVSMHHMGKIKPLMDKVRKKYKDNKQEQQQAIMKLYKEHGINPMAGCLPILLQMPVLISLFFVLRNFPGFRHAVFIPGLFVDLAAADHILKLPFGDVTLPLIGSIHYLNILPILMSTLMFLQMKRAPKSEDPQQAATQKMMPYMMLFFGLILYNYQSGLALYMITSTTIGMGEQAYIKKHIREIDEREDVKKREKEVVKKKGITVKSSGKRKPA